MYIDQLKTEFETLQIVPPQLMKPCTEEEIQQLEQTLGLRFPLAYREFLLWIGHGVGGLLSGYDWSFDKIFYLKDAAVELLEKNKTTEVLPEDALVFFMNRGYSFLYLCISEGEDPFVYEYSENKDPHVFMQAFRQFSEFLSFYLDVSRGYVEKVKTEINELRRSNPKLAEEFILFERARGYNL